MCHFERFYESSATFMLNISIIAVLFPYFKWYKTVAFNTTILDSLICCNDFERSSTDILTLPI